MTQNVRPTGFVVNGLPLGPQLGAPFADSRSRRQRSPINFNPNTGNKRTPLQAAAIHSTSRSTKPLAFPAATLLTLWNDVKPTLHTRRWFRRAPEPLFSVATPATSSKTGTRT